METITLPAGNPASIQTAVELLQEGEIIAFPTDTVYGLGANCILFTRYHQAFRG